MELLNEIYDSDIIETSNGDYFDKTYQIRKATRAVLFNNKNEIAILFVSKDNYYKLPGGGVEKGETLEESLKREIIEEVGCNISQKEDIGIVIEYRNQFEQLQVSYCYLADVKGEIGTPSFTEKELSNGFNLKWVSLDNAIELLQNAKPETYIGKIITKRDLTFLLKAKTLLK